MQRSLDLQRNEKDRKQIAFGLFSSERGIRTLDTTGMNRVL